MSEEAGTKSRYTNHSLRATPTTCLFNLDVPEKIIQDKSGHRSLTGLRAYEKVTVEQEHNVTRILSAIDTDERKIGQVDEKKSDGDDDKGNKGAIFSGQLNNCVFNFYK